MKLVVIYHNRKPFYYTVYGEDYRALSIERNKWSLKVWLAANGLKIGKKSRPVIFGPTLKEYEFFVEPK